MCAIERYRNMEAKSRAPCDPLPMRKPIRAIVIAITALLSSVALSVAAAFTAAISAADPQLFIVGGTGQSNSNTIGADESKNPDGSRVILYSRTWNENARQHYVDTFVPEEFKLPTTTKCGTGGPRTNPTCYAIAYPASARIWPILPGATFDQSVDIGVQALNEAILAYNPAEAGNNAALFGYSQGATVVSRSKEYFAINQEKALQDNLRFVLAANTQRPNGGLFTRATKIPGQPTLVGTLLDGYIPGIGLWLGNPTPTSGVSDPVPTPTDPPPKPCTDPGAAACTTWDIAIQYDGIADAPNYLFSLAFVNSLLGVGYLHPTYLANNIKSGSGLPGGSFLPSGSAPGTSIQGYAVEGYVGPNPKLSEALLNEKNHAVYGDTVYVTIPFDKKFQVLPILQPLAILANVNFLKPIVETTIELITPALQTVIDWDYDRTINPGVPTPIKLFSVPFVDYNPFERIGELVTAVGQGIKDATDGHPPGWSAATATATATAAAVDSDSTRAAAAATELADAVVETDSAGSGSDGSDVTDSDVFETVAETDSAGSGDDGSDVTDLDIVETVAATAADSSAAEETKLTTIKSGNKFGPGGSTAADATGMNTQGDNDSADQVSPNTDSSSDDDSGDADSATAAASDAAA